MPPPRREDEGINRLRSAMYSRKYGDTMRPRPRHDLDFPEPEVSEDWQHAPADEGRSAPRLERMVLPRRSRALPILRWFLASAVIFFLGAVAFFVYYLYFGGFASISARNIDIVITGPPEIAGGASATLNVTITNRNREALQSAQLIATFPAGTRLGPNSCASNTCTISLGNMPPGQRYQINLPAIYEGSAGSHASVGMQVQYQLAGSNSVFTTSSDYAFTFSSSPLSISADANSETISGQPMQISLTINSNSSQTISQVVMQSTYPFGFNQTSADPAPISNGLWQLGSLVPGESKTITIQGTLTGQTNEQENFHFMVGTNSGATSTNGMTQLSDIDVPITVAEPFLNLSLAVNGASSTGAVVVASGQTVNVDVQYKNNLSTEIDNAVVVAKLSGLALNGQTIYSGNGFYRSTDNAVLWDKTTTQGELAAVPAGASGRLSFNFLIPTSTELVGTPDPTLVISVDAAGTRVGQSGVPENLQSTASQKIVVASDLQIKSQGLYFTNPFGVTGNMPPSAGSETQYAAVLTITNTTNAIDGAKVTATLPPYVRFAGEWKPQSENIIFNNSTGEFTWNVGHIDPGTGLNGSPSRQVAVALSVTPSTSQIGSAPVLLQGIELTGVDSLTGQTVTKKAADITTDIAGDPGFSSVCAKVVSAGAVGTASTCH